MDIHEEVKSILLAEFAKAKERNPRYSLRSYARKIGLSVSTMSDVFSGKRNISLKNAKRILYGLDLEKDDIERILALGDPTVSNIYTPLAMDTFQLISHWYFYGILSLTETKGFQSSPQWIATRLGLPEETIQEAIEILLRLQLLKKERGVLKTTGQSLEAISEEVTVPALRKANRENLQLATEALEEVSVELRDFTAITFSMSPHKITEARKLIKDFRRRLVRLMESSAKSEVYKMNVQLFPLSKPISENYK